MADLLHTAADEAETEDPQTIARNTRIGMILFLVYLAFYAGFVLLNAFVPNTMSWLPFAGINLAVLYGLLLIVVAFVLSLVYGWLCRKTTTTVQKTEGGAA